MVTDAWAFAIGLGGDFLLGFAFGLELFEAWFVFLRVGNVGLSFLVQGTFPEKAPMSMSFSTIKGNVLIIQGLKPIDVSISKENSG